MVIMQQSPSLSGLVPHLLLMVPRHTWTGSEMSFPSEFWQCLWSEIIKHTGLWDQLRLWAHGPSWKINLHLQIQLGLSLVRKGLNPPSPTWKKNDQAGSVWEIKRNKFITETRQIVPLHPSSIRQPLVPSAPIPAETCWNSQRQSNQPPLLPW